MRHGESTTVVVLGDGESRRCAVDGDGDGRSAGDGDGRRVGGVGGASDVVIIRFSIRLVIT
jgi:hypothetical protein